MLKKLYLLLILIFFGQLNAGAADLLEVYQQALYSDPIFQQAIAESLVTRDNVPISISYLLPHLSIFSNPTVSRYGYSGTDYRTGTIGNINFYDPKNLTQRTYALDLSLSQPVFNFSLYTNVAIQLANAKSACATLNAALQDLMIRVAKAYFAILKDKEEITYTKASRRYYHFQLKQITDQYEAGIKTLTDVYTARAAYESSVAAYIVAHKKLINDKENLKAMTNVDYDYFSYLKNNFPLPTLKPTHKTNWIDRALQQNWSIKAAQYSLIAAKENITQQFSGHLPTVTLQSHFTKYYTYNINRYSSYIDANGAGSTSERSIGLNIEIPLFSGGGVNSKINQAKHFYEQQQQILEETIRTTINNTSQSLMNIIAGISQIKADQYIITATTQSLQGTLDRFQAGIETLLDVLNREENLYAAQITYATDRYDLINNLLILKAAAGTLSFEDLKIVNGWLVQTNPVHPEQNKLWRQSNAIRQGNKKQSQTKHQLAILNRAGPKNDMVDHLNDRINQVQTENRENYHKIQMQNKRLKEEIKSLKATLFALKNQSHISSS